MDNRNVYYLLATGFILILILPYVTGGGDPPVICDKGFKVENGVCVSIELDECKGIETDTCKPFYESGDIIGETTWVITTNYKDGSTYTIKSRSQEFIRLLQVYQSEGRNVCDNKSFGDRCLTGSEELDSVDFIFDWRIVKNLAVSNYDSDIRVKVRCQNPESEFCFVDGQYIPYILRVVDNRPVIMITEDALNNVVMRDIPYDIMESERPLSIVNIGRADSAKLCQIYRVSQHGDIECTNINNMFNLRHTKDANALLPLDSTYLVLEIEGTLTADVTDQNGFTYKAEFSFDDSLYNYLYLPGQNIIGYLGNDQPISNTRMVIV